MERQFWISSYQTAQGVLGFGEITHVFRDGFEKKAKCSCGCDLACCPVWSNVRKEFGNNPEEIKSNISILRSVEAHKSFLKVAFNLISKDKIEKYRSLNERLFSSLATDDCDAIVDSSKYAGRALSLFRLFPDKVTVICLTRSPEGILESFRKKTEEQPQKTLIAIVIYYLFVLACLRVVCWRLGDTAVKVCYEDLCADPEREIKRIERCCVVDLSETRRRLRENDWFYTGHIVTGNRLRNKGRIKFASGSKVPDISGMVRVAAMIMRLWRWVLRF